MKLKLADLIARLTRGYVAATGKQPDNLARIKIRLEAAEKLRQQNKVIDIRDRLPGLEGLLQTGLVRKGRNVQKTTPKPAVDPKLRTAEDMMEENKKAIKRFEEKMKKSKDLKPEDPENLAGGGRTGLSYLLAEDTNERVPLNTGGKSPDEIEEREYEGPYYETDKAEEALKELARRYIEMKVAPAKVPISDSIQLMFDLDRMKIGGNKDFLGGEIDFGYNKNFGREGESYGIGYRKSFAAGGKLASKLVQQIIRKYKGRVDDKLLNQMLTDRNPQRLAEVMATIDEALIMQQKGMGPNQIIETVKESFKRKKQAEGGITRVPFAAGGINRLRRLFLKMLGAGAATAAGVKSGILSFGGKKSAAKKVAQQVITTPNAPGKPKWFDALVTRIVNEGEDVTKQFAYKERMKVHTKPISKTEEVTVYRDLDDNSVRVNYGQKLKIDETKPYERGNISRASNDPDQIDLIVREGEVIEPDLTTGKGGGKTKSSFEASEAEPRAVGGPEDADIEFDGIREVNNVDDLMQDVSSLEEFATGKKLTGKKAAKAKKKREDFQRFTEDQVEQANYLEEKYGPYDDSAMDDFSSGGIARMLGE